AVAPALTFPHLERDAGRDPGSYQQQHRRVRRDLAPAIRLPSDLRGRRPAACAGLLGAERDPQAATPRPDADRGGRPSGHTARLLGRLRYAAGTIGRHLASVGLERAAAWRRDTSAGRACCVTYTHDPHPCADARTPGRTAAPGRPGRTTNRRVGAAPRR